LTRLSDFDYELPRELIAQKPAEERDRSRLLYLRADGTLGHHVFRDLPELLEPGDLLILNDTRVFPARLEGVRAGGGRAELLLLERIDPTLMRWGPTPSASRSGTGPPLGRWRVLAKPGRKLRPGDRVLFGDGRIEAKVISVEDEGQRLVEFRFEGDWDALLEELGRTPLPPYIESAAADEARNRARYQTIYARPRGSIAAPTAGLHFTRATFEALERRGIDVGFITLHVGHGTFEPIREEMIDAHRMGSESYVIPDETLAKLKAAKRVIAVGTTSVRALESAALAGFPSGWQKTSLFITPGFEFRVVSGLLTNFHLPKSSLLILVSALGGRERALAAYREAVQERYRFYSFGDAMLIFRCG
jgi:S-adenosylmethionine:tRNA ribosyltransferase-isomerase